MSFKARCIRQHDVRACRACHQEGPFPAAAFAITGDHQPQERVWGELRTFNRIHEAILRALSED
jgi:hypothetical protein